MRNLTMQEIKRLAEKLYKDLSWTPWIGHDEKIFKKMFKMSNKSLKKLILYTMSKYNIDVIGDIKSLSEFKGKDSIYSELEDKLGKIFVRNN